MISTKIDGSPATAGNQLFDLLALISNPDVYAQRMEDLNKAIEKNQTFVELVAPASDIIALREKMNADVEAARKTLDEANAAAKKTIESAKAEAASLLSEAQKLVLEKRALAADIIKEAKKESVCVEGKLKKLSLQEIALANKSAALDVRDHDVALRLSDANNLKLEYEEKIAAIAAKHQEFLKGLV